MNLGLLNLQQQTATTLLQISYFAIGDCCTGMLKSQKLGNTKINTTHTNIQIITAIEYFVL